MTSSWGKNLQLTIFGQSHGPAVGMVLEGLPAGLTLDMEDLRIFMQRRAPARAAWASPRREEDEPEFISGLHQGHTCGGPLAALLNNNDAHSADYIQTTRVPRPGHADFTAWAHYGPLVDLRGGGHFSGRLTAPLCLAGGICRQFLAQMQIYIGAHVLAVGDIMDSPFEAEQLSKEQLLQPGQAIFPVLDKGAGESMVELLLKLRQEGDSIGGLVEAAAIGLPAGLGGPLFAGLENRLAQALFAIPALKGLEFGAGFAGTLLRGSQHNDAFIITEQAIRTKTNHHGGILGGISSGMPLILRAAFKPTPSIAQEQQSVDIDNFQEVSLTIKGRHDSCIAPRAVPCVEAVMALVLLDGLLERYPHCLSRGKEW